MPEEIVFFVSSTPQGLAARSADGLLSARAGALPDLMAAINAALATYFGEGRVPKRIVLRFETEKGEKPRGPEQLPLV